MSLTATDLPAMLGDLAALLDTLTGEACREIAADASTLEAVRRVCSMLHRLHQFGDDPDPAAPSVRMPIDFSPLTGKPRAWIDAENATAADHWDPRIWKGA